MRWPSFALLTVETVGAHGSLGMFAKTEKVIYTVFSGEKVIRPIFVGLAIAGLVGFGSISAASAQTSIAEPPPAPVAPANPLEGLLGGGGLVGGGGTTGQPAGIGSALNSSTGGSDLLSSMLGGGGLGGGLSGLGGLSGTLPSGGPSGLLSNFVQGLGIQDVLNSGKMPSSAELGN